MAKEKPTTKICKHCAMEIPYGAKICPNCRKKQGPGCLTLVLGALGILILLGVIGSLGGGSKSSGGSSAPAPAAAAGTAAASQAGNEGKKAAETTAAETEAPREYLAVSVQELVDELEANALKAQDKYKNQYLEVTGYLNVIDSSGKYIALYPEEISITGVRCDLKNDTQKAQAANMSAGDLVTLRGKCTDVGEVLGYNLSVDSIDGYEETGSSKEFEISDDGYMVVSANELAEIAKDNPIKAQNAFKGQKIAVTGRLGVIDSSGKYISLDTDDSWDFTNIQCYLKNDDQRAIIMELSKGDKLTVKGKCKDYGELLGYQIDIESIE